MAGSRDDGTFPRWLWVLALLGVIVGLLYALREVLTPVFFAFLIAYMLDPVVDKFEERNLPRAVGIGVMLTGVLGILALFVIFALPEIVSDTVAFLRELPEVLLRLRDTLEPWFVEHGITLPHDMTEAIERLDLDRDQLAEAARPVGAALSWLLGGTVSLLGAIAGLVMIPVFAAYLLHDFDRITAGIRDLVPPRWRPFVVDVAKEVDEVLGAFIRGQFIIMVILGILYATAYGLLGVRLALVIGLVAGFLSFIPYVGGATALGLAVLMCLLDWSGWSQLVGVVVAYTIIQVFEGFVLTPRIVGEKVGLPAVWVLFALMVGGELFGFMGVLLALPAAAVLKVFVLRALAWYRKSPWMGHPAHSGSVFGAILREEGMPDDDDLRAAKARAEEGDPRPTTAADEPEPS